MDRPPESKSDSLEHFQGSGVTHLPAARAKSIPRAEKRALATIYAAQCNAPRYRASSDFSDP